MKKRHFALSIITLITLSCYNIQAAPSHARRIAKTATETSEYGKLVTVAEENFSKFTAGSEQEPVEEALALDWYGNFDDSKLNQSGWGGNKVHEAGGCAFIQQDGDLSTPSNLMLSDAVDYRIYVSFRARLLDKASTGTVYLAMGYTDPVEIAVLDGEWKEFNYESTVAFTGTYIRFTASDDWFIDDVVVRKVVPFVSAPEALTFNQYTGQGFTAVWSPVEDAAYYVLTLFNVDTDGNMDQIKSGIRAYDCSYTFTDLPETDGYYAFTVTTVTSEGKRSDPSYALLVEALLTPVTHDATNITANGFTANWDAVDHALGYDVYAYRETLAEQTADVDLVNTDFSFVKASDSSDMESVSYDLFPGWVINVPLFEDGVIGMDGARAPIMTDMFASMESPALDLSNGDGSIIITVSAKSTRDAKLTFSLYTMKNGAYPIYPESYHAITDMPFENFETYTFTLTGGGKSSVIYIETADWGQTWIDDLKISQHVYAGQTVSTPMFNTVTTETSADITDIDLTDGKYYYTLRAMGLSLDESYYISSDFTAPHYVAYSSGIDDAVIANASASVNGNVINIDNPEGAIVNICDITGRTIHSDYTGSIKTTVTLNHQGVYLVTIGNKTIKVVY